MLGSEYQYSVVLSPFWKMLELRRYGVRFIGWCSAHHFRLLIGPVSIQCTDIGLYRFFSFFTNLTYIGICAYFFASAVQTTFFALNSRSGRPDEGYPLKEWPRVLRYLHVLLLTTVTTFRKSRYNFITLLSRLRHMDHYRL